MSAPTTAPRLLPLRLVPLGAVLLLLPVAAAVAGDGLPEVDLSTPAAIKKALARKEPPVRLAAAREALTVQHKDLVSPLVKCLEDDVREVRAAAAAALRAREEERDRKQAAKGVAALLHPLPREPKPDQLEMEKLLVPILEDLAQPGSIKALLDVHTEGPQEEIRARLLAVANIPSAEAIEALIAFGAKRRRGRGHRTSFSQALKVATGENFGGDPDRWRAWWKKAKKNFDFEEAAARRQAKRDQRARKEEKKKQGRKREKKK